MAVPSFLSYFKTLSIGPAPGIEPTTTRSAGKCFTNWANPDAVEDMQSKSTSGRASGRVREKMENSAENFAK